MSLLMLGRLTHQEIDIHIHTCIIVRETNNSAHVYTCMCIYIYRHTYTHVYTCMHTYVCIIHV